MNNRVSDFYLGITSRKAVMTGGAIAAPKLTDASSAEYLGLGSYCSLALFVFKKLV